MQDGPLLDQTKLSPDELSSELSSNRTAMSFARTAMSSDRTLMSVIRTSLSLIAFGFTIFQFFHTIRENIRPDAISSGGPRRLGLALIILGVLLLAIGIANHLKETKSRRQRREMLFEKGLIHHSEPVKVSNILVVAILLMMVGLAAMVDVAVHVVP
jgi:putative membrane protein